MEMKFEKGNIIQTNDNAWGRGFPPEIIGKITCIDKLHGLDDAMLTPRDYLCKIEFMSSQFETSYLNGDEFDVICEGINNTKCDNCSLKFYCWTSG